MPIEFPPRPTTKRELVECIERQHANLHALIDALNETEMLAPISEWSARDHIAHLIPWQGKALAAIEGRPAYDGLGLDTPPADNRDFEAINATLQERWHSASLAEVIGAFDATHNSVLVALQSVSGTALQQPYAPDDPDGTTVMEVVCADTYEHCFEHETWIREQLDAFRARTH